VVESMSCPSCSSPVKPGQAFCANCGASLSGSNGGPGAVAEPALEPAPELATLPEPEPAAEPAPDPGPALAPAPGLDPALLSDPGAGAAGRIPGGYVSPASSEPQQPWTLQPSSSASLGARNIGTSPSLSVGAMPVFPPGAATIPVGGERAQGDGAVPAPWPAAAQSAVAQAPAPVSYPATNPAVGQPSTAASLGGSVRAALPESTRELVAFALSAAGAALGIASFFLPWTGVTGIGVGTTGEKIAPNQWAFAMPAGIPLLLITILVLSAVAGSDRIQIEVPRFATGIARITDLILPMILGGLYLGVVLLYVTLPSSFGYGMGIVILMVSAVLLIAGSVVSIFYPPEPAPTGR
jgi:hypothetical protein